MSHIPPPISDQPVLMLQGIHYQHGARALHGVTLQVRRGEIAAVLGLNGAGKTTLMQTISCLLRPDKGVVIFKGEDITATDPGLVVAQGLSHVALGHSVFAHLKTIDNLRMGAYTRTDPIGVTKDLEAVYRHFPILRDRADWVAGELSTYQQRALALACAIMASPDLILIDSLSDGLTPEQTHDVLEQVVRINRERGTTILIAEENANAALAVADYGYVMDKGQIIQEGSSANLRNKLHVATTGAPSRRLHETM